MVFALCACGNSTAPAADPTEAPAEATPEATEAPVVSEETAAVLSKWTDDLYEPETSITYSATIVWPADASAVETAAQDVRPNTMIVAVDENLTVSTLDGEVLSENLAEYLASVKPTTLPALYIRDDATAAAVNAFAAEYSLADTFVVADYEHTQDVKDICDANVGVLGIIDWREAKLSTERSDLLTVIQNTNASHAKIAIIPEEIATLDAVEYMRGMLLTVWAETSADTTAIYTQITNGVNGIVCEDYAAVAEAISSFNDVTTLVRHVLITGHRGLPEAVLFTDLDKLEEGDCFYLHILDETLAYQVDQIKVVEPEHTEDLEITAGQDYCTLVTCTPYAINTHRMLVRGTRIPYNGEEEANTPQAVQYQALRTGTVVKRVVDAWPWIAVTGSIVIGGEALLLLLLLHRCKKREEDD